MRGVSTHTLHMEYGASPEQHSDTHSDTHYHTQSHTIHTHTHTHTLATHRHRQTNTHFNFNFMIHTQRERYTQTHSNTTLSSFCLSQVAGGGLKVHAFYERFSAEQRFLAGVQLLGLVQPVPPGGGHLDPVGTHRQRLGGGPQEEGKTAESKSCSSGNGWLAKIVTL